MFQIPHQSSQLPPEHRLTIDTSYILLVTLSEPLKKLVRDSSKARKRLSANLEILKKFLTHLLICS